MKLTHFQIAHFCRGLSLLLHGGLSLAEGMFLLAQEESGDMGILLRSLGEELDAGTALSEGLEKTGVFPAHVCAMAAMGERSGRIEEALSHLAQFHEQQHRSRQQMKQALVYPSLIFALMLGVVLVLLIKVLPVFDGVYASLGGRLTGVAGWLRQLGNVLEKGLPFLFVLLTAAAMGCLLYRFCSPFRNLTEGWYQRHFGDRGCARKFNNARFARGLAMGIGSGLSLEEAMVLSEDLLTGIPGAAKRCRDCLERMEQGDSLPEAMETTGLLSPADSRMLAVGLRGGNADRVLEDIARRMEEAAWDALNAAVAKVEPAMVLTASILVGAILLAVMLPLMNILSALG